MRPNAIDLLDGIAWSFETYIVPELDDPLAQSAARSIRNLLDHLRARLGEEAQALWDDSREKRELLAQVAERAQLLGAFALGDAAGAGLDVAAVAASRPVPVEDLLIENELLKEAVCAVIDALQEGRDALGQVYDELDALLRAQLRRQVDREDRWIAPAFEGRPPF